jgi:hypothetical protein
MIISLPSIQGSGEEQATIYFKNINRSSSTEQEGVFKLKYSDKVLGYVDVSVQPLGNTYRVFFNGIRYSKKSSGKESSVEFPKTILSSRFITIELGANGEYHILSYQGTITNFLNDVFKKLVPLLKEYTEFGESVVETGIAKELSYEKTYQALARDKPLGHCIARALQLLKQYPVSDNQTIESNICKAKFLEKTVTKEDGKTVKMTRSGIPAPGTSLDTSPGLSALSQLFYEISFQKTPKLFTQPQIGIISLQEYKKFMENMNYLFEESKESKESKESIKTLNTNDKIREATIGQIKNKRDLTLCNKIGVKDQSIPITKNTAAHVQNYVRQLFQRQYEHAGKCGAIFKQLFLIEREKGTNRLKLSIHPRVLQRGLPELARINREARNVLVNYYSQCEDIYRKGMMKIVDEKVSASQATAQTTAATTATAAPVISEPIPNPIPALSLSNPVQFSAVPPALVPSAPSASPASLHSCCSSVLCRCCCSCSCCSIAA